MTAVCRALKPDVRRVYLLAITENLLGAAQTVDHYDDACDSVLTEIVSLSHWLHDRAERNRAHFADPTNETGNL